MDFRAILAGLFLSATAADAATLTFNGQTYADLPGFDSTVTLAPIALLGLGIFGLGALRRRA